MRPIWVDEPVPITTPIARPAVTRVPENAMQDWSPGHGIPPDCRGIFFHRNRFAGQGRFLDAQAVHLKQAHVRGYAVSRAQAHDIAGNDIPGINIRPDSVAQNMRAQREHFAYALERLFSLAFLDKSDKGVDYYHAQDNTRVNPVDQQGGYGRGCEQHIDKRVIEMLEKPFEQSGAGRSG